jgi:outer membrane beta-barrel protein
MRARTGCLKKRSLSALFLFFCLASAINAGAADTPLDKNVRPAGEADEIPNVFRDMGVVQRRAMPKAGRFLFSSYGGFDFSDGPYTNYSLNVNPGYAINDFFEVYFNFAPKFLVMQRSIVDAVRSLTLKNGDRADIVAATPERQLGAELLWAPAYGKDSLGLKMIIRSDTFLKAGVSMVTYDMGSRMRFVLGVGKTYFLNNSWGVRVCVDYGYLQTYQDNKETTRNMALVEAGAVFYL